MQRLMDKSAEKIRSFGTIPIVTKLHARYYTLHILYFRNFLYYFVRKNYQYQKI